MKNIIEQAINTPWKVFCEIGRVILNPFSGLFFSLCGVSIDSGCRLYGFPVVLRHRHSKIMIGKNFENRNWLISNPLGVNHQTMLTTWSRNAVLKIGDNVGITGGSICASEEVTIGNNCLIGANCTIIDTDFHPIEARSRRYSKSAKSKKIIIEDNVFVGMNSTILKGVSIGRNSVIGAGSIVRKNIPANAIYVDGKIITLKK